MSYTGFFDLLETRFYNPTVTASISRENVRKADVVDSFFSEKYARFSELLQAPEVKRAFLPNYSIADIIARERLFRLLIESFDGIQWVRVIDSGGLRILFSTYTPDILRSDDQLHNYANYNEPFLPYELIAVRAGEAPKFTFDGRAARFLFSFPLYDSFDVFCGTALFSLSINALSDRLTNEGRLRFGQDITVITDPAGLVFGITAAGESAFPAQIASAWRNDGVRTTRLSSPLARSHLALISTKTSQGFFIGRLVNEEVFSLPQEMQIILLVSVFITVFLTAFLIFNFRQDPVTVVQNRLKQLQVSLVEQFYELKGEANWTRWIRDLDSRRDEIIFQLKQGIKFASEDKSESIDILINKSWDELLEVLGGRKEQGIDEEKLHSVLKRVIADLAKAQFPQFSGAASYQSPGSNVIAPNIGKPSLLMKATAIVKGLKQIDPVEELEEPAALEDLADEDAATVVDMMEEEEHEDLSGDDIAYLASRIEFSPDLESESLEEESIKEDLEIVSPFAGMVFDFSENEKSQFEKNEFIEEQEGVHYINEEALSSTSETETPLNPELKDLVDSVIK